MVFQQFENTYIVRLVPGEEILASITELVRSARIRLASVSGIGAVDQVTAGLYSISEKKYHSKEYNGEFEIISLNGTVSEMDGAPYLHLHISISDESGAVYGGHLTRAVVSATAEIVLTAIPGAVNRFFEPGIGLNLLEL